MLTSTSPNLSAQRGASEYEVWCPDGELIARQDRLTLGDTVQITVQPTGREVLQSLARIRSTVPRAYWTLAADEHASVAVHLTGVISQLRSVTSPFVFQTDGWVPVMELAQTRDAGSNHVHPGRSIWAPSGAPVLLGFLVTFTDAKISAVRDAAA